MANEISADATDKAEDAADARRVTALEDKAKYGLMAGMASDIGAENEAKVAKRASHALRKAEDAAAQDTQKIMGILQDIKNAQAQEEHAVWAKA